MSEPTSVPPTATGLLVSIHMEPLLSRGRVALATYLLRIPVEERPIAGGHICAITREDFVQNVELALRFVEAGGTPCLHVLCDTGALCVGIEQRHIRSHVR